MWSTASTFAVALVWLSGVVAGFLHLANYQTSPGKATSAPAVWPSESALHLAKDRPTLVMLIHPKCPCSRATIAGLNALLARQKDRALIWVLFLDPESRGSAWTNTDLWNSAKALPGVRVRRDAASREASLFGAATSGHALLYGADGRLRFEGGITASRGHDGNNAGRESLDALLSGRPSNHEKTPVYGCPLAANAPGDCCDPVSTKAPEKARPTR